MTVAFVAFPRLLFYKYNYVKFLVVFWKAHVTQKASDHDQFLTWHTRECCVEVLKNVSMYKHIRTSMPPVGVFLKCCCCCCCISGATWEGRRGVRTTSGDGATRGGESEVSNKYNWKVWNLKAIANSAEIAEITTQCNRREWILKFFKNVELIYITLCTWTL